MLRSIFRVPSRTIYSKVPKTFYNVPYNEQYEQRDFVWEKTISKPYNIVPVPSLKDLVSIEHYYIDTDNKLTITNTISLELVKVINKDR